MASLPPTAPRTLCGGAVHAEASVLLVWGVLLARGPWGAPFSPLAGQAR